MRENNLSLPLMCSYVLQKKMCSYNLLVRPYKVVTKIRLITLITFGQIFITY